jgi:acetyl esterase/lipase
LGSDWFYRGEAFGIDVARGISMRSVCVWVIATLQVLVVAALAASQDETARPAPVEYVYAQPGGTQLIAYVFSPDDSSATKRSAIVLFHGGGWAMGEPAWAFSRAKHFAERGMVAVAAQYRLSDQKEITPHEAMSDARAVFRWVRTHADSLGIDPKRVAAYGWSAGAHLAASAAIFDTGASSDTVSAIPDALVLVSPAVSVEKDGWLRRLLLGRGSTRDISPDEHVRKGLPPTLILQGNMDTVTPLAGAQQFCERMRAAGNVCELHVYEGFGHLFTPAGIPDDGMPQPDPAISADATRRAERFLESLGLLK